jgi:hypothetical protein
MTVRNPKTGADRRTRHGLALEESAKEILAHLRGETKLPTQRIVLPTTSMSPETKADSNAS